MLVELLQGGSALVVQAEDALRASDARQAEGPDRHQRVLGMHGERGRPQHRAAEPAGQLFETRDEVDGRPDAGEIKPVAAANIAVQHLADMQSQPKAHALGDGEVGDCGSRLERGSQTGGAGGGDAGIIADREDREQAVTDEFQYLAAPFEDCWNLAVEIAVQQFGQLRRRQPVGSAVKPRISESQIAARIVWVSPRRMRPERIRSPA